MEVKIPYGKKNIYVNIPVPFKILSPHKIDVSNEKTVINNALKKPIRTDSFKEFVNKSDKLLVIVNDASKPTPTSKILEYIYPFISNHLDLKFLIAVGTHKTPTRDEIRVIFKRFYDDCKEKIVIHDSKNEKNMEYLGRTKSGTEVYINKMITEFKNIIVIGSIEPHYFAGYTGGRKAFIPGVAAYKTIEMNHQFALQDKACSLNVTDNPVHTDLTDAVNLIKNVNIFSIQTVLTNDYKIYYVKCGDIINSFNSSLKYANDVYCVPIKNKANIIITVVPYPMDINLYQSQHALENAKLALENNGIIILVSKCRKGIGNDAFLNILSKADTPEDVLNIYGGEYKLGSHKSYRILKIKEKADIFAVTDLDEKIIKKAKFKPYSNIQTAVDEAIKIITQQEKKPRIAIIPAGNLTVPFIEKEKT